MDPNKEHANGLNKDQGCPYFVVLRSNTGNADGEENSSQPVTSALSGLAYGTYERNSVGQECLNHPSRYDMFQRTRVMNRFDPETSQHVVLLNRRPEPE